MIEQLKTIRHHLEPLKNNSGARKALTALTQLEAMVGGQKPVAWMLPSDGGDCAVFREPSDFLPTYSTAGWTPLYAAPVAQQYEAGDMASAAAQGFRDGVASVTQQEPVAWLCIVNTADAGPTKFFTAPSDPRGSPVYAAPVAQQPRQRPKMTPEDIAAEDAAGGVFAAGALVAQQPQARPDFADEWTGYLKDGETPFERFLRERKDVQSALKLYQRALEENERLKAQQPQAKPHKPLFADLIAQHPGLREELLEMDKQPQAEKPLAPLEPASSYVQPVPDHCDRIVWRNRYYHLPLKQPQAEAVPQDVGQLEYRGNSVAYIHQKMTAYRGAIDAAWQSMRDAGHHPDGRTSLAQAITKALAPQQAEAVPSSDLNPDEGDPVTLWAEIWRLREAVKGPDGYATWQDAATAERIRRVRAESKQAEEAKAVPTHDDTDLIKQMLEALRSCSGVSHWPALIPTINAARKRLETPQQAEAVQWPQGSSTIHCQLLDMGKAMAKERSREIGDAWNQLADLLALLSKMRAAPQHPQAEAVPSDVEAVRKALDRAFTMGQSYWADADSESIRANKRSDVTRAKFLEMREKVCAVKAAAVPDVVRDAVVAEREACAALAQGYAGQVGDVAWAVAAAIRGRGNAAIAQQKGASHE